METGIPAFIPMRKDLLVRELHDEVIVYDGRTRRAHCLNPTAAAIWKLCDGKKSVEEIASALNQALAAPVDEGLVWLAVHEFKKSGLLQNEISPAVEQHMMSRRELMRKIAVGAALALPIATSIVVPTPAAAVSPLKRAPSRRPKRSN
jgi:Coenzyme PQQ synthesis protein D (PqqD)